MLIYVFLIFLSLMAPYGLGISHADTRLGMHFTQQEIYCWRQRAGIDAQGLNGITCPVKYVAAGDVSTNSPGDWNRIVTNANAFVAAPSTFRWNGTTNLTMNGACVTNANNTGPDIKDNVEMKDAAFAYLVTGTTSYSTAVRTELLAQVALSAVDFSNTAKWSHNSGCLTGVNEPSSNIAFWVMRMMYAYDYTKATWSGPQTTTFFTWLTNTVNFLQWFHTTNPNGPIQRWPNRASDSYGTSPHPQGSCSFFIFYFGGPCRYQWSEPWTNLTGGQANMTGQAGILLGNSTMVDHAKRWFREFFMFMVWPDHTQGELGRWTAQFPESGMRYAGGGLEAVAEFADALARNGDTSMYTYTTSTGLYGSAGGTKGLLNAWTRYLQYRDHTVIRYATATSTQQTTNWIIDGIEPTDSNRQDINDVKGGAILNSYYKNAYFKTHYTRGATTPFDTPAYGTLIAGGADAWQGPIYSYPGILFMFGDMTDDAAKGLNPYSATDSTPPATITGTAGTAVGTSRINWIFDLPTDDSGTIADIIFRSCFVAACTPGNPVALGNVTSYAQTGLAANTLSRVQFTAVDGSGNEGALPTAVGVTTGVTSLVGHWDLAETTGTSAADSSGNSHTGTLRNAAVACGNPPTAGCPTWDTPGVILDGINDDIRVTRQPLLEPIAVTLCARVTRIGTQVNYANIVNKTYQNDSTPFYSYALQDDRGGVGDDVITFGTGHTGGNHALDAPANGLPDGVMTIICGSYDPNGAAPQKKIYLNGNLAASATLTLPILYDQLATGDLYFGMNGTDKFFHGNIREVRIYAGALTPAEILALSDPPDILAPNAPTGLQVTAASSIAIDIACTPPTTNTDDTVLTDLAGHRIKWCTGNLCTPSTDITPDLGTACTYQHTGLTPNTEYGYTVLAFDDEANDSVQTSPEYVITPAVAGGLALTHFRFGVPTLAADAPQWVTDEDLSASIRSSGYVRGRFQIENTGGLVTQFYPLSCTSNGTDYFPLTNDCAGDGDLFGVCLQAAHGGVVNGESAVNRLTIPGGSTYRAGAFANTAVGLPSLAVDTDEVIEIEYDFGFRYMALAAEVCCRPVNADGTDLDSYPIGDACLTVYAGSMTR